MNVKRFTARTSRDALNLVRQAFGDDAVVLSTKPCPEGVEVLAMAPESVQQIERLSASSIAARGNAPQNTTPARQPAAKPAARPAAAPAQPTMNPDVQDDVARLSMSTLSFQDYVRERMLKRRRAAIRKRGSRIRARTSPILARASAIRARTTTPTCPAPSNSAWPPAAASPRRPRPRRTWPWSRPPHNVPRTASRRCCARKCATTPRPSRRRRNPRP
jgi:flagellar biosynthesis protein FlhF